MSLLRLTIIVRDIDDDGLMDLAVEADQTVGSEAIAKICRFVADSLVKPPDEESTSQTHNQVWFPHKVEQP